MSDEAALTACGHDAEGRVQVCHEVRLRLADSTCAVRIGERGTARRLRREAVLIMQQHLRLEALERGEP